MGLGVGWGRQVTATPAETQSDKDTYVLTRLDTFAELGGNLRWS